jgi:hypothetical protein
MTTTLTPPTDAPLPWAAHDPGNDWPEVLDADGHIVAHVSVFADANSPLAHRGMVSIDAARYLVACANAAPRLVKERDQWHQNCLDLIAARDTALARVAALEQALAKQAPVIEAARKQRAEWDRYNTQTVLRYGWERATHATEEAIRSLDKETP